MMYYCVTQGSADRLNGLVTKSSDRRESRGLNPEVNVDYQLLSYLLQLLGIL